MATGLLITVVGFGSSFAVVVHGLGAMGATPAQAAGGLMVLSLAMGVLSIALSLWLRMPILSAWSTPGGYPEALGAFMIAGW